MEKRVVFQNRWLPYLLVAPQLAITLIFFFLPAGQAIYQSVLMQDPFGLSTEFVGLQNFETLLSDPNYVSSFKITMRMFGIDWNYLVDADQALTLLVIAAVWKQVSYNFIFFLAGLQAIPKSLLEAAAMDGAGPFRRFWTVVFPLLSPTTFFLLVMNIVYAFFDTFAIVDATTMGGPGQDTNILVYKVFVDGFRNMDFGGSAAQSVILMVMVIILTVIQFRFIERRVNY